MRSVSCHTRCESVVRCHDAPLSESGAGQATKDTHIVARWMSELSSRLLKVLLSESLPYPSRGLRRPELQGNVRVLNLNSHEHELEIRSEVEVRWPTVDQQRMRLPHYWSADIDLRAAAGLKAFGWGWRTVLLLAVGSWATIQGPCMNDNACRWRSDRSKEQEDRRPARPRACVRQG